MSYALSKFNLRFGDSPLLVVGRLAKLASLGPAVNLHEEKSVRALDDTRRGDVRTSRPCRRSRPDRTSVALRPTAAAEPEPNPPDGRSRRRREAGPSEHGRAGKATRTRGPVAVVRGAYLDGVREHWTAVY